MIIITEEGCKECDANRDRLETLMIMAPKAVWDDLRELSQLREVHFHGESCPALEKKDAPVDHIVTYAAELCARPCEDTLTKANACIDALSMFDATRPDSIKIEVSGDGCKINNIEYSSGSELVIMLVKAIIHVADSAMTGSINLIPA